MNSFRDIEEIRGRNIYHYERSNRFRAYCCGCISSESNLTLVCFLWAAISFYFAVLAFLQKSPFYSYVGTVPLVAFGAVNLLFGIVTLTCMVLYISWTHKIRIAPIENRYGMNDTKKIVFAITASALAVLIVTLVNFILFIKNKSDFTEWCIGESITNVEDQYNSASNHTSFSPDRLIDDTDIYNCERLYQDELKWSLLCLIIMFVVYTHWILIIAAREALDLYRQRGLMPPLTEFSNIAPRGEKLKDMDAYHSTKPSRNILENLLTHKQYGEFIPAEDLIHDKQLDMVISSDREKCVDKQTNSNVIHFEESINSSKEIQYPCKALNNGAPIQSSEHSAQIIQLV